MQLHYKTDRIGFRSSSVCTLRQGHAGPGTIRLVWRVQPPGLTLVLTRLLHVGSLAVLIRGTCALDKTPFVWRLLWKDGSVSC